MARLLQLSTTLLTLLSPCALASPVPQIGTPTDVVTREVASTATVVDIATFVYGSGSARSTDVGFTTCTSVVYTTSTRTRTRSMVPSRPSTRPLSMTANTTAQISGTLLTSSVPLLTTGLSSLRNASTTVFRNASTTSFPTKASNETVSLTAVANSTALVRNATSTTASNTSTTSAPPLLTPTTLTCRPSAFAPAPTNTGTVDGCTQWYVAQPGDYCLAIAQQFGIPVDTFMAWNPSVLPPTCARLLAGDAYCVQICPPSASAGLEASVTGTSTTAATTLSTIPSTSSPPAPTSTDLAGRDVYRPYTGDGTAADGWPTESDWVSFASMFTANTPQIRESCAAWGVPLNSDSETAELRAQLLSVGEATGVDPRFILAVVMQESTGCVRVITTAYSHANPGLMQSFNGTGSCNTNSAPLGLPGVPPAPEGSVQTPCPESEIRQQLLDGTNGTVWGPGLVQDLEAQGATDSSRWYRAARLYNGGAIVEGDLSLPCCTASYASDIANRLTGWVTAPRNFPG